MSSSLSVSFCNRGETRADLKCGGKHQSESDKLTKCNGVEAFSSCLASFGFGEADFLNNQTSKVQLFTEFITVMLYIHDVSSL